MMKTLAKSNTWLIMRPVTLKHLNAIVKLFNRKQIVEWHENIEPKDLFKQNLLKVSCHFTLSYDLCHLNLEQSEIFDFFRWKCVLVFASIRLNDTNNLSRNYIELFFCVLFLYNSLYYSSFVLRMLLDLIWF